jgi:hypothetical protein
LFVGADAGYNATIGDLAVGGHFGSWDEKNSVGAGWLPGADALGEHTEVIGNGPDPEVRLVTLDELAVLEGGASDLINDGICFGGVVIASGAENFANTIK